METIKMNGSHDEGKSSEPGETDRLELPNGNSAHHVPRSQVISSGPHARRVVLTSSSDLVSSAVTRRNRKAGA